MEAARAISFTGTPPGTAQDASGGPEAVQAGAGRRYIDVEVVGVRPGESDPAQEAAAAERNGDGSAEGLINLMAGKRPFTG